MSNVDIKRAIHARLNGAFLEMKDETNRLTRNGRCLLSHEFHHRGNLLAMRYAWLIE